MSKVDKILDKILKKVNQVEKLHDKESLLCEEVKDLVEDVRKQQTDIEEEEDFEEEELDEDIEEDIDEEEEKD